MTDLETTHTTYFVPGVVITDSDYNILFWNRTAESLFNIKMEEVLGKNLKEILERIGAGRLFDAISKGEKKVVEINTGLKSLYIFAFSEKVNVGGTEYLVIFIEEITEEIRKKRIHELIVNNVRDVIALVDFEGKIHYASPSITIVLGYSVEEVAGKSVFEFVHPEDLEAMKRIFQEAVSMGVGKATCRVKRKDGTYIWVEAVGKVISFEEKIGVISARDVTETVTLEKLLRVINNVGKVIVHAKDEESLLSNVCNELATFFPAVSIWLKDEGLTKSCGKDFEICNFAEKVAKEKKILFETCEVCGKVKAAFPMVADSELKGVLVTCLDRRQKLDEENLQMLDVLANDIAFAIKALKLEEAKRKAYRQIEDNIYKFAILVDEIKNPLTAIMGLAEEKVEDEEVKKKIIEQVERIKNIVKKLDEGWLESEKVREFLRRYL
ncbi:putative PAS/PAC sensor protein [Ferroglobus placidus DSM 10642]|uniref:Putative PAS/PAC sensor protein n=1 Tax=Ferroglobus placidus (strain DSM 10642 / AEDII12DO) TaxID=589924 RepID=D3RYE8_FERPA|nr:PAS domain S-box protein [Ferroglobus placidus]ADC65511.1 putative PAS/PAC sensor protein [Ferroglobus placidus DSM 10642]